MDEKRDNIETKEKSHGRMIKSSDLKGYEVRNLKGEKLGKLDDILLDYDNGVIGYGILSVGGFLGIGDDLYAIPWRSFEINANEEFLALDADKEKLKNAPSFNKEKWPDMDKRKWHTDIHTYYAAQPYWNYAGGHMSDPHTNTPDKEVDPRRNKTHI